MTNIVKLSAVFLLTLALIAGSWYYSSSTTSQDSRHDGALRIMSDGDNNTHRRKLQRRFISTTLNALVGVVTPAISERVQYAVVEYYNHYNFDDNLGYETSPQVLGNVAWMTATTNHDREEHGVTIPSTNASTTTGTGTVPSASSSCEEEARVDYKINSIDGFGDISIDSISFVQNSQNIRLKFQNRQAGAEWSGEWRIKASFPTLIAATTASLTTMSDANDPNKECSGSSRSSGTVQPQSVNGTIHFSDVTVDALVLVKGETDRVVLFAGTSEFASARVQSFSYDYVSVDASGTGMFALLNAENDEESVDVATFLVNEGDGGSLETYLEGLLREALQVEIDYYLPRSLIP